MDVLQDESCYNRSFADQFYQRYDYDADNRITQVETSKDGLLWDKDANYTYYPHGPLARINLSDLQVQGVDYAYTIQGWLKSINGDSPDPVKDIGGDGMSTSPYRKCLLKSSLYYFKDDYRSSTEPMFSLIRIQSTQDYLIKRDFGTFNFGCAQNKTCYFVIVFCYINSKFYKVSGFKNSDFQELYADCKRLNFTPNLSEVFYDRKSGISYIPYDDFKKSLNNRKRMEKVNEQCLPCIQDVKVLR